MKIKKIKVLVVDDSAFMRKMLTDIISSNDGFEVVGQGRDGEDALRKIAELDPDVVTMDVEMPKMDGLMALENIMKNNPLPVVMLSSLTTYSAEQTLRALEMGAVDFIAKPSGHISLDIDKIQDEIITKLRVASSAHKQLNKSMKTYEPLPELPKTNVIAELDSPAATGKVQKLVVMGTSTGGPKALHTVMSRLRVYGHAAVLIVQHMPAGFTKSLAERLNSISSYQVKEAEEGDLISSGCAYIAPGGFHMKVRSRGQDQICIELDQSEPRGGHRPCVDVLFESAAQTFPYRIVGVIMTGMGADGSSGIQNIKAKNGKIIAEHQSTSIVYGMPRAAVETGTVDKIVPLEGIADAIISYL